jgi:hypothetical protein
MHRRFAVSELYRKDIRFRLKNGCLRPEKYPSRYEMPEVRVAFSKGAFGNGKPSSPPTNSIGNSGRLAFRSGINDQGGRHDQRPRGRETPDICRQLEAVRHNCRA